MLKADALLKADAVMLGAGVAGVALFGLLWFLRKYPNAFNPASPDNVAYGGVNAAGAALTGNQDFRLGVSLWESLNPGAVERERAFFAPVLPRAALETPAPIGASLGSSVWEWFNPGARERERAMLGG